MATYLKTGIGVEQSLAADHQVSRVVEGILREIENRGDAAIRECSERLDGWSPPDFRLSQQEIDRLLAKVNPDTRRDIEFAQKQIRCFAEAQRSALLDLEVEVLPGITLGHKNIPVESVGCYVPGGRYPMIASAHMSIITARVAGVKRIIACAPPFKGGPHPAIVAAMHFGGADDIYVLGGVQAVAAMALGTETIGAVDMIVG